MPEIEAKFAVPDPAAVLALLETDTLGPFAVVERRRIVQTDEYFDTPERQVAAAGASVRERRVGGEVLFTYKEGSTGGDRFRRNEFEEPAAGRDLPGWLYALFDEGRAELAFPPELLQSVLKIHTERLALDLEDLADEPARLELSFDRSEFRGPRGQAESYELEIELIEGTEAALDRAVGWLQGELPLTPSKASKYKRALEAVG